MEAALGSQALYRFGCALSDPTRTEILLILREVVVKRQDQR